MCTVSTNFHMNLLAKVPPISAPINPNHNSTPVRLPSINELTSNSAVSSLQSSPKMKDNGHRVSLPLIGHAPNSGSGSLSGQGYSPASSTVVGSPNDASQLPKFPLKPLSSSGSNYMLATPNSTTNANAQKLPSPTLPYHDENHHQHQYQQPPHPVHYYAYQQSPMQLPHGVPHHQHQSPQQQTHYSPPNGYYHPYYYPQGQPPHLGYPPLGSSAGVAPGAPGAEYSLPEVINKPTNKCHRCGTTETPEWRRGPNGVRTLCNACGLFHAKLVKRKGAALAAEEVLNNKVCKGKNGRRISIKKQLLNENNLLKHEAITASALQQPQHPVAASEGAAPTAPPAPYRHHTLPPPNQHAFPLSSTLPPPVMNGYHMPLLRN